MIKDTSSPLLRSSEDAMEVLQDMAGDVLESGCRRGELEEVEEAIKENLGGGRDDGKQGR